ncbi:olfactory receptor 8K1-like [Gracilinanus agilis]|uniref:olfactory receptor 8K1-like n=1 Tax=Gracilinanus agilis TaxID=191870 RepID=UPI001CFE8BAD|nr:olfactory receptor 8K1-like [Gracilinanus agilis]
MEPQSSRLLNFILVGLTDQSEVQDPLFLLFFLIYTVTLLGNLGMIILTKIDSHLQTPMYFFLTQLAFTDVGYSTAIGPKFLVNFIVEKNTISYNWYVTQLFVFGTFTINEFFILSAMAYGHYVAICKPLLYMVIMTDMVCLVLVAISYIYGIFVSLLIIVKIFTLTFWDSNVIQHFYYGTLPLLSLLCSDTQEIELIVFIFSVLNFLSSLLIVLISYMLLSVAILRMNSAEGRHKAFSTCNSHLTVVVVFYGSLLFMYLKPQSIHSFETDKMASVFYRLVIPMLNPLIYSLRNKEVKIALKRTIEN